MVDTNAIIDAIEAGNETRADIADYVDRAPNHIGRDLRDLVNQGVLYREKEGYTYHYFIAQGEDATDTEPQDNVDLDRGAYKAPVDRSYNFADEVPEDVNDYIPTNGEMESIEAKVAARNEMGTLPRFLISGPSGNGKTTLPESMADEREMPYFEVNMSNAIYEADLLGTTNVVGEETVWEDGPITQALLSSQVRPTILVIDEVNRATPEVGNVLFSALDHRARVSLTGGRGGETIEGDPENLLVFGTINEGREYGGAGDMDHALKRRFKFKYETDYLGLGHPARERDLVADRTPAHAGLAELMVEAANDVRELANDPDPDVKLNVGIPTAALIDWAGASYANDKAGMTDPVDEAAREIIRLYYGDGPQADKVETLLLAPLGGAPFDEDEFAAWSGERGSRLVCDECGWSEYEDDAPEGALDFMECPECGDVLSWDR